MADWYEYPDVILDDAFYSQIIDFTDARDISPSKEMDQASPKPLDMGGEARSTDLHEPSKLKEAEYETNCLKKEKLEAMAREEALLRQIEGLQRDLSHEATLRQWAEEERDMALAHLQAKFETEVNAFQDEIIHLKQEITSEVDKRLKAEEREAFALEELKTIRASHEEVITMALIPETTRNTTEALKHYVKEKSLKMKELEELVTGKETEVEALTNEVSLVKESLEKVKVSANTKSQKWALEKHALMKEMEKLKQKTVEDDHLRNTLLENKAEMQQLAATSSKLKRESVALNNQLRTLRGLLHKQSEEKAQMVEQCEKMEQQLEVTEKKKTQASANWAAEKNSIKTDFEKQLRANMSEIQHLKNNIEDMKEKAKEQSASHHQALAELQEEKTSALKEVLDLKTVLAKKCDESSELQEMLSVLYQELERKRRRWYQKLF